MADSDVFGSLGWQFWFPDSTLVLDGAMGTLLRDWGLPEQTPAEWWNREFPERVMKAHTEYAKAGSELLLTNTFGANRLRLKQHGLEALTRSLNIQAVALAKGAHGQRSKPQVWGSVGPLGEPTTFATAQDIYKEQIEALLEGGVDGLCIETMTQMEQALAALKVATAHETPTIVMVAVDSVGSLLDDETQALVGIRELADEGAAAVGFNCTAEFALLEELVKKSVETVGAPIVVKPSAGFPTPDGSGGWRYPSTPLRWTKQVVKLRTAGARIIGGCCGTTPKHIQSLHMRLVVEAGRNPGKNGE